ncbi:MAG: uroporphyrinogen-III C-methyltransferase [Acidobacteriota bacterium]|nr:uroporphyrinogen-III C-methyltransferase [Acidobacteriota bacterium]
MTKAKKGTVYLVGAGPGDPELLTLKAVSLLESADVIYHDDLVARQILDLARAKALVISVGKRCGAKRVTQDQINRKLVESAQRGLGVVRLKSGDPLIFGRAGEEIAALSADGIAFEVVPGISTAFAAAAALRCSLTDRTTASSVLLATGHHAEKDNAELSPTRVYYMPGSNLALHARHLLESGEPPDLPCALVSRVSQPDQAVLRTTLRDLANAIAPASPAVLLTGWPLADITQLRVSCQLPLPIAPQPHTLADPF